MTRTPCREWHLILPWTRQVISQLKTDFPQYFQQISQEGDFGVSLASCSGRYDSEFIVLIPVFLSFSRLSIFRETSVILVF